MKRLSAIRFWSVLTVLIVGAAAHAELKPERIGQVETLPEAYPSQWILVHDVAFLHMLDGRTIIMDAAAETLAQQHKGMFSSSLIAQIVQSSVRPEIYVAETYYSRGTRGVRTDVVTIYDTRTLAPIGEVELGKSGRAMLLPHKFAARLIDDERLLLIYNFSPAMSVNVVDVEARELLNAVALPGCAAVYPTGRRGFSSLCGEGALFTVLLDEDGQVEKTTRSEPFFDVESDALFERPAWIEGMAYFPSFTGNIQPIDFRGDEPDVGEPWPMTDKKSVGWRPGGLEIADSDAGGMMYVMMHPDGSEGSQSAPGAEVWRIDPAKRQRIARHTLKMPGVSLALTRDAQQPLLVVTNVEMQLDVYDAVTGEHLRTISGFGGETPLLVFGAK